MMNNSIGNKLKSLRKQKGLSQEQVSERLHISQSAYARMENGESNSWAAHLNEISTLYDIKPEDLFKNETIVINNNQNIGTSNNAIVINQLSEKTIEQYEETIKQLTQIITDLKSK